MEIQYVEHFKISSVYLSAHYAGCRAAAALSRCHPEQDEDCSSCWPGLQAGTRWHLPSTSPSQASGLFIIFRKTKINHLSPPGSGGGGAGAGGGQYCTGLGGGASTAAAHTSVVRRRPRGAQCAAPHRVTRDHQPPRVTCHVSAVSLVSVRGCQLRDVAAGERVRAAEPRQAARAVP